MGVDDQTARGRVRETGKYVVRRALHRAGLDLGRDPYAARLARTLATRGITTVLDVGANTGQYGRQLRYAGFDGRILSCEPLSGAFGVLARHAARDDRWDVLNVAVGAEAGEAVINVSANSYSSSLLDVTDTHVDSDPRSAVVGSEEVAVVTVDELVDDRGLDPSTTLLKVDTQGFEKAVLDGATASLPTLAAVQLELSLVELYAGQALAPEITRVVESHGLELWGMETGIAGSDGRLLQYDGLFVRSTG